MDNFDSIEEILDFAIAEEMGAVAFYRDLAGKARNAHMRQALEGFAEEEKGHKKRLEHMRRDPAALNKAFPSEKVADLKIAEILVPIKPNPNMDYADAISIAMRKEKSAMLMYKMLAAMTDDEAMRDTFLALSQEEAKHKLRFETEYDEVVLKED
jgi:rubrerythrin